MYILYFTVTLIIPFTLIFFGFFWKNHPPKTISDTYGYRTDMSSKNQKTWDFAHQYIRKILEYEGAALCAASVIIMLILRNSGDNTLGIVVLVITAVQVAGLFFPIIPTEHALNSHFDKNGRGKKK